MPILREFLLRGGTPVMDDFHGDIEWELIDGDEAGVPRRRMITCRRRTRSSRASTSGRVSAGAGPRFVLLRPHVGEGWHHAGAAGHRGRQRPAMVLMNWNTDMGDGWEWSNAEQYPGYIQHTAQAYRMMINEIIYTLTH